MNNLVNIQNNFMLVKDLTDIVDFEVIEKEFSSLSWKKNQYNHISEDFNFFDKECFVETKEKIEDECVSYLKNAHKCYDFENLIMTNSWGNETKQNESHHPHQHPFSVVSGVIYLDDNPDNLNFFVEMDLKPIPYFNTIKNPYMRLKDLIGTENNLKNHMVLFLSNVGHGVEQVINDSMPRRSISFNTFWKGFVGELEHELNRHKF